MNQSKTKLVSMSYLDCCYKLSIVHKKGMHRRDMTFFSLRFIIKLSSATLIPKPKCPAPEIHLYFLLPTLHEQSHLSTIRLGQLHQIRSQKTWCLDHKFIQTNRQVSISIRTLKYPIDLFLAQPFKAK